MPRSALPTAAAETTPRPVRIAFGSYLGSAALVAFAGGYFLALHFALAGGDEPSPWVLALIFAPWLVWLIAACPAHWRLAIAPTAVVAAAMLVWSFGPALARHAQAIVLVENLAFHLGFAGLFGTSLLPGRVALVTRFAQASRGSALPDQVVAYTRRVTLAWAVFFLAVAALSTVLYATSRPAWSLFVNLLIWPAVALMFVAEFAIRTRVLRGLPYDSLIDSVRAWRSYRTPRAVRGPRQG